MLYEDQVSPAFAAKVTDISNQLEIDPSWLMQTMQFESNLSPSIQNKSTGATGLIQFMPSTAAALGTTTDELASMSDVDQLDYVLAYYQPYKPKLLRFVDLYMSTLFPIALGKDDTYVLQTDTISAASVAKNNPIFAQGKDYITVGDVNAVMMSKLPPLPDTPADATATDDSDVTVATFQASADTVSKFASRNWVAIAITAVVLIGATWALWKYKGKLIGAASRVT